MCLCIPSKICAFHDDESLVTVDTLGVQRQISIHLISEKLAIGDYLLIHVGFAISKLNNEEAQESLIEYKSMLENMSAEDAQALFN
ncbi:hydrogenase assembly chaperone HypC/HupF [Psychromonas sp. CNPT3]|uniref:HypC/HybG/HupF family hydrogenase formation chaperone n=1 Tax=Psychromonas sp. CNPT3 TaxID=314282 RepID=UPI00006E8939|nr:HypC/HybG/HupF family hydrogenase formation chaperone [Psychromonas sp. CNPT3]AGH82396.1 hydrogenase assembly chaperone HypC/HupF [Psychromonas sp. CNPT3]